MRDDVGVAFRVKGSLANGQAPAKLEDADARDQIGWLWTAQEIDRQACRHGLQAELAQSTKYCNVNAKIRQFEHGRPRNCATGANGALIVRHSNDGFIWVYPFDRDTTVAFLHLWEVSFDEPRHLVCSEMG